MRRSRPDSSPADDGPALVVTYGNTTRKTRPLDCDLIVVGRAPGCDLGLVSPEVAPIHCLIARVPVGWRILLADYVPEPFRNLG